MSGSAYNNLRDAGVEAKVASPIALGVGIFQSFIENAFGIVGGAAKAFGKTA
jgi:hypothetical protein